MKKKKKKLTRISRVKKVKTIIRGGKLFRGRGKSTILLFITKNWGVLAWNKSRKSNKLIDFLLFKHNLRRCKPYFLVRNFYYYIRHEICEDGVFFRFKHFCFVHFIVVSNKSKPNTFGCRKPFFESNRAYKHRDDEYRVNFSVIQSSFIIRQLLFKVKKKKKKSC